MLEVTFKSRGRKGRKWTALFDLGSNEENTMAALRVAHQNNAAIIAAIVLSPQR